MTTTSISQDTDLEAIFELTDNQRVVSDGPLSALYASALHHLYAKKIDEETGICIESAANDQLHARSRWLQQRGALPTTSDTYETVGMLYGVRKGAAAVSDIIVVSDVLSEMSQAQKARSAIIIDAQEIPDLNGGSAADQHVCVSPFEQALQGIAQEHGVPVFASLEAFLASPRPEGEA